MANALNSGEVVARRKGKLWPILLVLSLLVVGFAINTLPSVMNGVNRVATSVLSGMTQALRVTVTAAYLAATNPIEASPEVEAELGKPLVFAPMEQIEWLSTESDRLEFRFDVTGPKGQAKATAVVSPAEDRFELKSLKVERDGKAILDLREP